MKKICKTIVTVLISVFIVTVILMQGNTYAVADGKIFANGIYRCYTDGEGGSNVFRKEITIGEYDSWEDVFNSDGNGMVALESTSSNLNNVQSCKDFFKKNASSTMKTTNTLASKQNSLRAFGYEGSTGGKCISFNLMRSKVHNGELVPGDDSYVVETDRLCSLDGTFDVSKEGNVWTEKSDNDNAISYVSFTLNGGNLHVSLFNGKGRNPTYSSKDYNLGQYRSIDALKGVLSSAVQDHFSGEDGKCVMDLTDENGAGQYKYCKSVTDFINEDTGDFSKRAVFTLNNREKASYVAMRNVSSSLSASNVSDLMFTSDEKYSLYYGYLKNIYGIESGQGKVCDVSTSPGSGYVHTALKQGGTFKECWVLAQINNSSDKKVNALHGNYFNGTQLTWQELAEELYNEFGDQIGEEAKEEPVGVDDGGDGDDEYNDACYDAGVDGVSWIVCPMINNLTDTADEMDKTINTLLSIDSKDYGYGSKVEGFWKEMVKIANVAVIVILLVIIVSQITGFGIDNYGIKKMLPKLLIMAILINFSFVICVIAVDLSNIFGEGLNQLFSGIGSSISGGQQNAITGFFGTIITLIFTVAGVGSLIGPLGVMSIFTVLLALVAVVFGVLLFFFSLGARMMLVILCIGISPLAFACYILPNTQILFKKWWDIFKAALLLFPICGALSGISIIIREIGSSSDNVMMMVISMISVVIPYYALPVLLRNALSAMPAIGAAVSSFTNAVRGGVRSGSDMFRNSDTYKEAQERAIRNNALGKVGFYRNRLNDPNNAATRSRDLQRLAKYQRVTASMSQQGIQNYETAFSDMDRGTIQSSLSDALKGNGADADLRASGAIKALIAQGGIEEAINELSNADWSRMGANVSKAVVDAMATSGIDIFSGFAKYRNTGGKGGLKEWSDGSIGQSEANVAGIKGRTLAEHLSENGPNAFNSYSKDEMKHIEKYKDNLRSQMGETNFGTAVSNAAISGKDAKTQTVAENIVKSELAGGNLNANNLGITSEKIGNMRDSFANAIKSGLEQYATSRAPVGTHINGNQLVRNEFAQQIAGARSDPNIVNKTSNIVRTTFGF